MFRELNGPAMVTLCSGCTRHIVKIDPKTGASTTLIKKEQLTPPGGKALVPQSYTFSNDNSSLPIFTNTAKVWRYRTKGDYWVLDMDNNKLTQIGKSRPCTNINVR